MKASKAARRTHQILRWTELIGKALTWRTADLIAREVEMELNEDIPVAIRSHDRVAAKKKEGLLKYMRALKSLIAPYDPDAREGYDDDEEPNDEGGDGPIRIGGPQFMSKKDKTQKICDTMLPGSAKAVSV
jgi:hypothetical protein